MMGDFNSMGDGRLLYFKRPDSGPGGHDCELATTSSANLVSSLLVNGNHKPVIDLDVPHTCVSSSTMGHSHLYIDVEMPWWRYRLLLWALKVAGVISAKFYDMAVARRQTMVRRPGVLKEDTASWSVSG